MVNCAAIPGELFESELFGYEKGAFTGANQTKKGLVEQANRGTLFLDEIGELPMHLQPKLLRVLNDRRLYRIGATRETMVDFRLLSTTNVNLAAAIKEKRFRSDLYYRISDFVIDLPPLRMRLENLGELAEFLVDKKARQLNLESRPLDGKALVFLKQQSWPGNIRQLDQVLMRALVLSQGQECINAGILRKVIDAAGCSNYQAAIQDLNVSVVEKRVSLKAINNDIILSIVRRFGNDIQQAARAAELSAAKIYRSLRNCKGTGDGREDINLTDDGENWSEK